MRRLNPMQIGLEGFGSLPLYTAMVASSRWSESGLGAGRAESASPAQPACVARARERGDALATLAVGGRVPS
jgi:hypothetical protein